MDTAEIVAKLTADTMANSYLMTYMAASRETLRKAGLELTSEIAQQLQSLSQLDPQHLPDDPHNPALAIAKKLKDPEFEADLKASYKAKMLEVLAQLEIELTPEAIAAFKAATAQDPENFASLFASVL